MTPVVEARAQRASNPRSLQRRYGQPVPSRTACLIDVYDTVLSVDTNRYLTELAELAEIEVDRFSAAVAPWGQAVSTGRATIREALEDVLTNHGRAGQDIAGLVAAEGELLRTFAQVADDVVPLLEQLSQQGVKTAFVSNCADNTRPLLDNLGLSQLVDELVLSCEVGVTKPNTQIFSIALGRLGVSAGQAVFVDDQQEFCDAAAELGITAVLIDRKGQANAISGLSDLQQFF
jgi:putative hydrolase of the HAD superfamily